MDDMGQSVSGHRIGQFGSGRYHAFELRPAARCFSGSVKRRAIPLGFQQGGAQILEGTQSLMQRRPDICDASVAQLLGVPPCLPDDPVKDLDHRIGDSSLPFHHADGENGQSPIAGNVAQAIGKVSFTLAAQARDPMGRPLDDRDARAGYEMLDIHKETISGTKTNRHARNQVMALIEEGRSYRWIAGDLGISKNTVTNIVKRYRENA